MAAGTCGGSVVSDLFDENAVKKRLKFTSTRIPGGVVVHETERDRVKRSEQPLVGGTRSAGHECPCRDSGLENPRSLTAWTERSGVKAVWIALHHGAKAQADWNRPVRSRTLGGVGPVADLTVSHGSPIREICFFVVAR
jgi:hypothetical protein